jgi:hypothetical protein
VITTHYILSGSGIGKTGYVNYDQQVAVQIILGIISAIYREEKIIKLYTTVIRRIKMEKEAAVS